MSARIRHPSRLRLGVGAAIVLVIGAVAVTVGIGMVRSAAAPVETIMPSTSAPTAPADAPLYVHVSGAVVAPGLYRVETGARLVDAIAAAGGFTETADQGAVNLARVVADGEQVVVLEQGAAPPASTGTAAADGIVDLNTADAAALDTLPRIGPAMAERILAWREENGRFTSVEDLLAVPGIGEKMLAALRDLVRV